MSTNAELIARYDRWSERPMTGSILQSERFQGFARELRDALEAAEAELTRRDTVIGHDELSTLCLSYLRPPKFSGGSWTLNPDALATAILERLAAAPVSLEAVILRLADVRR